MSIVWCNLSYLKIKSNTEPHTGVRLPLPLDTKEEKAEKKKKPYINKRRIMFDIDYLGTQYCFVIEKGYCWNGANIPRLLWFLIGSMGENDFLTPSMAHDFMCENHKIVGDDRQLSSMIFRELLIASGVSRFKANIMYKAVDSYQKFMRWGK